jgi:hypothetical protein
VRCFTLSRTYPCNSLASILPVTQWSHTLCTWRYPEVLLAQEQLKAKHLSGIGSPGSPDQFLRHTSVSELYSDTRMLERSMTAWCECGCLDLPAFTHASIAAAYSVLLSCLLCKSFGCVLR